MPIHDDNNPNFIQRHGGPRNSPAHPSPQKLARETQSGSAENTSGAPSLLDSARNMLINGGQFTAGTHVNPNVTIFNICEGANPQIRTQNDHSGQTTNRNRNRRRRPMRPQPQAATMMGPVQQRSNEIYERHLRLKERGHPLWSPQSNRALSIPYRAQGARVGDVEMLTDDGAFDFLFNICVPRDDPINPRQLPDNFVPICPSIDSDDIRQFLQITSDSYLTSSSVAESRTNKHSSGLIFESSKSEGAILTMPEGLYSEDLRSVSRLREYVAFHAEDWYKFIKGPRGCEAQNGDLRVVVGCDKTTSWGVATFANSSLNTKFRLKFSALGEHPSQRNARNKYMWEHSGVAAVKVGPERGENDELGETDSNRLRNQCLFLRTLNVTLSQTAWEEMFPQTVAVADENNSGSRMLDRESSHQVSSNTPANMGQRDSTSDIRSSSCNGVLHPWKIINQYLLEQARVAVTHDRDWSGIVAKDTYLSDPSQILPLVCSTNDIFLNHNIGLVFLELKQNDENGMSSEEAKVPELIKSIQDGDFMLDHYLFGSQDDRALYLQELCNSLPSSSTSDSILVSSFSKGHPERPFSLDEICNDDFDVTHRQSIINLQANLNLLPSQHADRASYLLRLGDALARRF